MWWHILLYIALLILLSAVWQFIIKQKLYHILKIELFFIIVLLFPILKNCEIIYEIFGLSNVCRIQKEVGSAHQKRYTCSVDIEISEGILFMEGNEKPRVKEAESSAASLMLFGLRNSNYVWLYVLNQGFVLFIVTTFHLGHQNRN